LRRLRSCAGWATDKDWAEFFGVSVATLNALKPQHPEFLEPLIRGKEIADAEVADRLFKRACGDNHKDTELHPSKGRSRTERHTRNTIRQTPLPAFSS
jgi:hypothetical protein